MTTDKLAEMLAAAPDRLWVGERGYWGHPREGAVEYIRADLVDGAEITRLNTALEHWRHEVGKLHSQVDRRNDELAQARAEVLRLRAVVAELTAANAALMVRENEARELIGKFLEWWPKEARRHPPEAVAARAWLAGEGK